MLLSTSPLLDTMSHAFIHCYIFTTILKRKCYFTVGHKDSKAWRG